MANSSLNIIAVSEAAAIEVGSDPLLSQRLSKGLLPGSYLKVSKKLLAIALEVS